MRLDYAIKRHPARTALCACDGRVFDVHARLSLSHAGEPTYTYSRQFGSTFEGLGMGLPLAALHARYLGGDLHVAPVARGVHASFTFDVTGHRREPGED